MNIKKILVFLLSFSFSFNALAIELDEATRTVALDSSNAVIITPEQVKRGKRLFNASCGSCHTGGITKTNPNVGLDSDALGLATPNRNSIAGLVDYMKNPTTYDGLESIAEVHPSIASADTVSYTQLVGSVGQVENIYKLWLKRRIQQKKRLLLMFR